MNSELKAKTRGCEVVENKSYGYDEAVDLCGHGSYSRYLLATCCVISNAVALDMFGFSIIVAASSCDLQLGLTETGLLASAPFAGVIFGFPWGYYADTRGRKRALLLSNAFGFAFAALSSFSISWQIMLVLKIIGCSFSSASYTMSIIYLGESIVSQHRSQYTFIMQAAYLGSELFSFALAYFLLPLDFKISIPWLAIDFRSWRLLSLIMAAWLGLGALMLIFARESPKFLANKGEYENALKVLQVIYEGNGGKKDDYPVKQLHIEEVQNSGGLCWQSIKEQTVPLFKPPLLCCTIFLFYLLAICASTNNIFFMWYPTMVNLFFNSVSNGSSSSSFCDKITDAIGTDNVVNGVCDDTISVNTLYSGMLYGVVFFSLTLLASQLASYRRSVLVISLVVSAVSGILVNLVEEPIVDLIAFTLQQGTSVGMASVMSYFVDMYPTCYRGMVTNLSMIFARITSLCGVNVVGLVISDYCTYTFDIWSCIVLSAVVVALVFLPSDKRIAK